MIDVFSDVIQFRGTHYDFGMMQGKLLKDSPIIKNRQKYVFSKRKHNYLINLDDYQKIICSFAPAIWDEINGLAEALNMSLQSAIEQFGGYYLEFQRSGCSIFSGADYFVRNYDYHPKTYDGRLLVYQPSDQGYATLGPSMQITGRTDGINEKGLIMGYNFVNRRGSADGFLCNMIGRIILETCENVDEAIDLLKEIPHRSTFNYVLLDKSGVTQVVEASSRAIEVRQTNICTNHFDVLTTENRHHTDDSIRRHKTMQAKQALMKDSFDVYKLMNDKEENVFGTDYTNSNGTLHTAIYYPKTGRAGFALGANRLPFMFDFKKWLQGAPFHVTQIRGQLETNQSFANTIST